MQTRPALEQHFLPRLLLRWVLLFAVLFPLSFSFERGGIFPDPGYYTQTVFEQLARFTGQWLLPSDTTAYYPLVSDSAGFYLNALNLLVLSFLAALTWTWFSKKQKQQALVFVLMTFVRYYLATIMLWYGFDKIFKVQFYLPEPNTLFTPLGEIHRDYLYWSTMGTSYTYTVFAGLTELCAALLLLFSRTYLLGALVTTGIMINVLMINIGFDISVKLYSCFLVLLCVILIAPHAKNLYRFFVLHVPATPTSWRPSWKTGKKKTFYLLTKTLVIILILGDALSPFIRAGNYNDDTYPRPFLHGAYQVTTFRLSSMQTNDNTWKRFFVHRHGYFIVQDQLDRMRDFELRYDTTEHLLRLSGYQKEVFTLKYAMDHEKITLSGIMGKDTLYTEAKKIDLNQLPLLQKEFGWTVHE